LRSPDAAYAYPRQPGFAEYPAVELRDQPTAAIRIPSVNGLFLKGWQHLNDEARSRYIQRTPLRKRHYRKFGIAGFSKEQVDESMEQLRQTVERIDAAVAWLCGDAISVADFCVLPTIVRMSDIRLEGVWTGLMHFQDWYGRMRARLSFGAAFYPEAHVSLEGRL